MEKKSALRGHRPSLGDSFAEHAHDGHGPGLSRNRNDRGNKPVRGPRNHPPLRTVGGSLYQGLGTGGGAEQGKTARRLLPGSLLQPHLFQIRGRNGGRSAGPCGGSRTFLPHPDGARDHREGEAAVSRGFRLEDSRKRILGRQAARFRTAPQKDGCVDSCPQECGRMERGTEVLAKESLPESALSSYRKKTQMPALAADAKTSTGRTRPETKADSGDTG